MSEFIHAVLESDRACAVCDADVCSHVMDGISDLRAEVAALREALRSLARIETDEEGLPVLVISCGWHCQTSDQTELPLVWAALSRPALTGNGGKP